MTLAGGGERLSHAVGCAFAACLERKQKREKECGVTATFDANRTTFTRDGSFRVTTATEAAEREEVMRQLQEKKAEAEVKAAVPVSSTSSPGLIGPAAPQQGPPSPSSSPPPSASSALGQQAIPRRHAPAEVLARQGSFRVFPVLSQKTSPFKRQFSLRVNEMPSTVQRKNDFPMKNTVPEVEGDSISSLCTQITSAFSRPPEDPFSSAPMPRPASSPQSPAAPVNGTAPAFPAVAAPLNPPALPPPLPARETNPWAQTPAPAHSGGDWSSPAAVLLTPPAPAASSSPAGSSHRRTPSEADRWLEEVTKSVRAPQPPAVVMAPAPALAPAPPFASMSVPAATAPPTAFMTSLPSSAVPLLPSRQPAYHHGPGPSPYPAPASYPAPAPAPYPVSNGLPYPQQSGLSYPQPSVPVVGITPSQMVANVFGSAAQPPPPSFPTLPPQYDVRAAASPFAKQPPPPSSAAGPAPFQPPNGSVAFNGGAESWAPSPLLLPPPAPSSPALPPPPPPAQPPADAFEAQWAALESRARQRTTPSPTNPFSSELHTTFEIQL